MNFPMRNCGTTLLEVGVVMALLAIGAAVSAWRINLVLPDLRLKAAARNLKADMHLARLVAIRRNTWVVSEFNTHLNSYILYIDDGGGDRTEANNFLHDPGEEILKTVQFHPQVRMYKAKFGSTIGKFAFDSSGIPHGGAGGIYMYNTMPHFRGVAVSRIGKITIKVSVDGGVWRPLQ